MAAYNGAEFIEEQLQSILDQIGPDDEVIVVDDASTDDTVTVIESLGDPRIRLERSPDNRGYVQTFGAALALARGQYILLSDQDDVWCPGRVKPMIDALKSHAVVATNLTIIGTTDHGIRGPYGQIDWRVHAGDSTHYARNILGILAGNRPYHGCTMGIRQEVLATTLPFPKYLKESHDLWTAIYGNLTHSIVHLEIRSIFKRLHSGNDTPPRPRWGYMVLVSRARLACAILQLTGRMWSRRAHGGRPSAIHRGL
jgi:glycosyltransferase involved in cell wall biosynthesis